MDLLNKSRIDRISELAYAVNRDERSSKADVSEGFLGLSDTQINNFSFLGLAARLWDGIRGNFPIMGAAAGEELDYSRTLERHHGQPFSATSAFIPRDVTHRAMSTTPGAKGGYLVNVQNIGFIDALQDTAVGFVMGAQLLQAPREGPAVLVKEVSGPTVTFLGAEGSNVSATDPTFTQYSATPKTVVALHEISEQLLTQVNAVSEAGIRRNLVQACIAAVNQAMLVGTGGAQPVGVTKSEGLNTVVGSSMDRAKCLDMQTKAHTGNAVLNRLTQGYVAAPATCALLANRQQYTGSDLTLWNGSLADGTVAGCRAMTTKSMTASTLLFGDFSQLYLIEFGPMQLAVNVADFSKGTVAIRLLWFIDVIVVEPKAFTLASSIS